MAFRREVFKKKAAQFMNIDESNVIILNMEKGVFNNAIEFCKEKGYQLKWSETNFTRNYSVNARKILAKKEDYSATQVKRANFARNAAGWKKQFGGMTQGSELELHPDEIQALIDQGYGIEYLD